MIDKYKTKFVFTFIFLIVLSFAIFDGFGNYYLYVFSGSLLMFTSIAFFIINNKTIFDKRLFILVVLWIIYHVISAFVSFSTNGLYVCFQHIAIILFGWYFVNVDNTYIDKKMLFIYLRIIHYVLLLLLLFMSFFNISGISKYESYIYIGLCTLPFALSIFKRRFLMGVNIIIISVLWSYLSYIIGARAQTISFILFIVLAVLFYILNKYEKNKISYFIFILFYVIVNLFPMVYTYLSQSSYREQLDNFALYFSDSRFFSGRDVLWSNIYNRISSPGNYIFGLGFTETSTIIRSNISLHNLYVTIFSEGGIFLVVLFGLILYRIWKLICSNKNRYSFLYMSFFCVYLYKQSFDVNMIENNLWIAFIAWICLGISASLGKKNGLIVELNLYEKKCNLDDSI